jgi:indole-3-glycerol phosphate synthase
LFRYGKCLRWWFVSDILKIILKAKAEEVAAAKERLPVEALGERIRGMPKCLNFYGAMTRPVERGIHVIAEIKRSSPSAGAIRPGLNPVEVAGAYQEAGADAISVLTDGRFFGGSLDDLQRVKEAVSLPVLRKDFIIDPYQVYEARAAGADAILLIAEALTPGAVMDLLILANSLTLTVLLEVHEMESLLQIKSMIGFPLKHYSLLGINNRNLKTMEVDLNHSLRLGELVDGKKTLVSESGIRTRADVEKLVKAGFGGVLIGETLMRSGDITATFKELFKK